MIAGDGNCGDPVHEDQFSPEFVRGRKRHCRHETADGRHCCTAAAGAQSPSCTCVHLPSEPRVRLRVCASAPLRVGLVLTRNVFIIRAFSLPLFFTRVRIIDIVPVRDFRSCFFFLAESPYALI